MYLHFFFFSSRRRHTRFKCDWSSDVCSSDLPPGSDLRDSFGWSIGAAYAVLTPLSVFGFLEGATAIARGQEDPVDLLVGAEFKLTKVLKLTGSVTRGLTKGAADWGVSAGLALRF